MIFFELNGYSGGRISGKNLESPRCQLCGGDTRAQMFGAFDMEIEIPKRIHEWPPFLGSIHYTAASQGVVDALAKDVSGVTFHRLKSLKGIDSSPLPDWLPDPPNYYIWEVTGKIQAEISLDEVVACPSCGRFIKKEFGDSEKPLLLIPETWDGSDVVRIGNFYSNAICVNRKVINILRNHGFHRQPWYGRQNRKTEALTFGSRAVPGISAIIIDSDTWYEDTIAALKEKFPKEAELLLASETMAHELSTNHDPKLSVVIHPRPAK